MLALAAGPAWGQIAYVQATPKMDQTLGASISASFPTKLTVGNTIIVVAWTWSGNTASAIPVVADSVGNTYTTLAQSVTGPNGGWGGFAIYSALPLPASQ